MRWRAWGASAAAVVISTVAVACGDPQPEAQRRPWGSLEDETGGSTGACARECEPPDQQTSPSESGPSEPGPSKPGGEPDGDADTSTGASEPDPTTTGDEPTPRCAPTLAPSGAVAQVHPVYLIPTDRDMQEPAREQIEKASAEVQAWFAGQLPTGGTFWLDEVEVVYTDHPADWYSEPHDGPSDVSTFFFNVAHDAFALTDGRFADPEHIWVYYIDADTACGQYGGAASQGVVVISANDIRGLLGQPRVAACPDEQPDDSPRCRWVGGLAHEIGHALGLPHPSECENGLPECDAQALMWFGYASYPGTYLRSVESDALITSPFIHAVPIDDACALECADD